MISIKDRLLAAWSCLTGAPFIVFRHSKSVKVNAPNVLFSKTGVVDLYIITNKIVCDIGVEGEGTFEIS